MSRVEAPATTRLDGIRQEAERSLFRARNGIQLIAGTRRPAVGVTPHRVIWRRGKARLLHYVSDKRTRRPPLLIVWSIVSRAYILDLRPGHSFIEHLLDAGFDVLLLDWGEPDAVDASNDLELYVDNYLPRAIERALEETHSPEIDLLGYCFGGVLSLLLTASGTDIPIRNLAVMATPIDLDHIPGVVQAFRRGNMDVDDLLDEDGNVPASVVYRGFASLRPTTDIFKYATLWERLWSDEFVDGYQAMAGWIRDQTPLPGAVARQMADLMLRRNLLATGELPLGDRLVRLAGVTCPVLNVMAEADHMVPPPASEGLRDLVGSEDYTDIRIPAGHIGLAAGRDAAKKTIPRITQWLNDRSS